MKTYLKLLISIFCQFMFVECDPVVNTGLGPIQGVTIKTPSSKYVDAFLGIPYAKPPIGPDRFLPPIRIQDPWRDALVAKYLPNSCIQGLKRGPDERMNWYISDSVESEDCLFLNIWVPNPKPEKVAVMVWIHGGGFNAGSSNIAKYDGAVLASEENVIVVSINYRLAIFGFLHIPDTDVSGNMGLFDQVEALKWVQENIGYFGGDKTRVTIFGESAGGISVAMHLVSPESKDLFHSGIIQSGPPLVLERLFHKDLQAKVASQIISNLHCSDEPSNQAIVECLRRVDAEPLKEQMVNTSYIAFLPVTDGKFFTYDFEISMVKKLFHKVEVMLGTTSEDGSIIPALLDSSAFSLREDYHPSRSDFQRLVKGIVSNGDDAVHSTIASFYTDWQDPNDPIKIREEILKMFTDFFMTCGTNTLAQHLMEAGRSVYLFQFSQVLSVSPFPKWMGSGHGDEIDFVFGLPLNPKSGFSKKEVHLAKKMMKYWANFAKYGNPNGKSASHSKSDSFQWPKYTSYGKEYINLSTNLTSGNGIRLRECAFWDHVLPELLRRTPKEL